MKQINIGINGFGRIGRAIYRILQNNSNLKVVAVNDIDPLIGNHAYLINYDTIYGQLSNKVKVNRQNNILISNSDKVVFFSEQKIEDVPWDNSGVDVVIDSSGIYSNVEGAHRIINSIVKKVIITHSPKDSIDQTIIIAANEKKYSKNKHHVISSSICDANACAPILKLLDEHFGIEDGFVTTLHPWLGYQNLVDGSLKSVSSPGHYWKDFALGRASQDSLIPKKTTLMPAIKMALPGMKQDINAMSFRVPTAIVSASDMTLTLRKNINEKDLLEKFNELAICYPEVVLLNEESLVSIDFKGISQSCVIDLRWLNIYGLNKLKLVIWYDNEWGYANRVIDVAKLSLC
jgi:glyceraldehyde 3-phosphate dehydrogenase